MDDNLLIFLIHSFLGVLVLSVGFFGDCGPDEFCDQMNIGKLLFNFYIFSLQLMLV